MPKIVRVHEIGGPENLKIDDLPSRQAGPGEVKLRVQAVGLNRAESLYMRGQYLEQPRVPSRLGYEAAGIVEAVGEGVDPSWLGKKVATVPGFSQNQYGVLGEEAIVPVSTLGEYPEKLSPLEGAAIWMQYMTAYGALVYYGKVTTGDFVVITAASSSVGVAAIQMVKAEGAVAIATTRTAKKRQELLDLGADHVIVMEDEALLERIQQITGGKGSRLIFDAVAGPGVEQLVEAAAPGGTVFEYGYLSQQPTPFPLLPALRKGVSLRGYTLLEIGTHPDRVEAAKQYINARLIDGRFQPRIAKVFPIAQIHEAYRYLESNQQIGKIVVSVE